MFKSVRICFCSIQLQDKLDAQEIELEAEKNRNKMVIETHSIELESLRTALMDSERIHSQTSTQNEELRQLKLDLTEQLELLAQSAANMTSRYDEAVTDRQKLESERDALLQEVEEARAEAEELRKQINDLQMVREMKTGPSVRYQT